MSFDRHDIRPAMDVYTFDNLYLGTVIAVTPGPATADENVAEQEAHSSTVSGELLGPMPTQTLGNLGSVTQSANQRFATAPDSGQLLGAGTIRFGKWWGLVGSRTLPLDAVQTVSMERVVLKRNV